MTGMQGFSNDGGEDRWLMREVEREKRKIERHIQANERRQEQHAVRD